MKKCRYKRCRRIRRALFLSVLVGTTDVRTAKQFVENMNLASETTVLSNLVLLYQPEVQYTP